MSTRKRAARTAEKSKKKASRHDDPLAQSDNHRILLTGSSFERGEYLSALPSVASLIEQSIWPIICANQEESSILASTASHQLAVLLSFQHREGHLMSNSILSFVRKEDLGAWVCACRAIFGWQPAMADLKASVAHFAVITWSASQRRSELWDSGLRKFLLGDDLGLWHWMPTRWREWELKKNAATLGYVWSTTEKPSRPPFLVTIVGDVMRLVEGEALAPPNDAETFTETNDEKTPQEINHILEWMFVHRALELLIDLLSSPHHRVRWYLIPFMQSHHFSVRCKLALGSSDSRQSHINDNLRLALKLLETIRGLEHFPIDDSNQSSLSSVEVRTIRHRRGTIFQKLCHRHYTNELPDIIYSGVGLLCQSPSSNHDRISFLRTALGGLPDESMLELIHRMRLVDKNANTQDIYNRDFLMAVLEDYIGIPGDPLDQLESLPLYPTELVLWDLSLIPPSHSNLLPVASNVLSLPKLHTHFLSFDDYLLRCFELMRFESSSEIRSDLVDVVRRVSPVLRQIHSDEADETEQKTEFAGWARMALELPSSLEILRVDKPLLGEMHPALVVAEFTLDLEPCGSSIRREWDELGEFDNVFLVAVDASKMDQQPAPLMRDYHLQHATYRQFDTDGDKRVPDEDDQTFPSRYGITAIRGCMVLHVRDGEGTIISEQGATQPLGTKRMFRVALDPAQYSIDSKSSTGTDVYRSFNMVVRRHGRENNFKAVLQTIRGLAAGTGSINRVIPSWLQPILLGHGEPSDASFRSEALREYARNTAGVANPDAFLDYGDTFLDEQHLRSSFGDTKMYVDGDDVADVKISKPRRNYRVRMTERDTTPVMEAASYDFPDGIDGNAVRFTPVQVEAIRSGISSGLTLVVGPPGTGKTDVAVQIIAGLYHSFPSQRTIVVTHSNAALNDIFQKVMARGDVNERYLLRLGAGENDLETNSTHDFTKPGRVAFCLQRRGKLLEEVQLLSESLGLIGTSERGIDGSTAYTCESAENLRRYDVNKRMRLFEDKVSALERPTKDTDVTAFFPFVTYFKADGNSITLAEAKSYFSKLNAIFDELAEYRPLELLRSQRQRSDYLLMKQARVVAMTCTHAAIARSHIIKLGFEYDNIVIEEAGQMTEIETFIPLLLQRGEANASSTGASRLKRVTFLGDHNQLPPVVKNACLANYSNLDQSMFSRLIRMGVPYVQLDKQGRARPEIAKLYSWRYDDLGNLDHILESNSFQLANPGLAHTFQVINVDNFEGKGETTPTAYFYQNLGEAEYVVALFQFLVLIGYPPQKITILTTYNGQKQLIHDILSQRCGDETPLAGVTPRAISTVDQYQGQQNDFVLLSLVRTSSVGHLRDIRRLVVAVSRARFGLYVFCRQDLFAASHELKQTFEQFESRPNRLQLVMGENYPSERKVDDKIPADKLFEVEDVSHLGALVHKMQEDLAQLT